jgi:hypothetical protein
MKTSNFFKPFFTAMILSAALVFVSCDNDDEDLDANNNNYTISGNASGSQEVPAVSTSAAATLNGSYNANTNILNYTINWTGLSNIVTDAHFHGPADAGVNAGAIHSLNLTLNGVSGTASGSVLIADSTEVHLLSGKIYYNLHTVLNPAGEIRGQVSTTLTN